MAKDYDILKKHYGEKFAQFCRANFPTILELGDGVLAEHIMSLFAPNKSLFDDIEKAKKWDAFKDYVYDYFDMEAYRVKESMEHPAELMHKVGYTLYECKTVEDVERFIPYWKQSERLCTFKDIPDRLKRCHVFFAVKDGAEALDRKSFKHPRRQDEYGTSVISLQFARGTSNHISIKNRYNHTVDNPDATFSNNLENICAGLTDSFSDHYGFKLRVVDSEFEMRYYTTDDEGKIYKYNKELNGIYYCPNNIIIQDGEVIQLDKFTQILIGQYVFDIKNKTITPYFPQKKSDPPDAFLESVGKIEKLDVIKGTPLGGRVIRIVHDNGKEIYLEINRDNNIVSYSDEHVEHLSDEFLFDFTKIKSVNLPALKTCGDSFLSCVTDLEYINVPNLESCGDDCFVAHSKMKELHLPKLTECGDDCFTDSNRLETLIIPSLKECGYHCFVLNHKLKNVYAPNLEICDDECFRMLGIEQIDLPKLKKCGDLCLARNPKLTKVIAPKLTECGEECFEEDPELQEILLLCEKYIYLTKQDTND